MVMVCSWVAQFPRCAHITLFIFAGFSSLAPGARHSIYARGIAREAVHRAGRIPNSDQWGGPEWPLEKGGKPLVLWGSVVCGHPHNTHGAAQGGGEGAMFWLFRATLLLDLYPKVERTSQRSPYVECLLNLRPPDKPLLTDRFLRPGLLEAAGGCLSMGVRKNTKKILHFWQSMHSPLIFYSYHPRNPRPLRPSIWCGPTGRSAARRPEFLLRVCGCKWLCRHGVIGVSVKIIHTFCVFLCELGFRSSVSEPGILSFVMQPLPSKLALHHHQ